MENVRFTKFNLNYIKNLPSVIQAELIIFEEAIPDDINNCIAGHNPFYKKERHEFLDHRPDLLQKLYQLRHQKRRLTEEDYFINVETDMNVQFIKDYPQFKQLIEGIEYRDEDRNVVKVVPIDQYLAEN